MLSQIFSRCGRPALLLVFGLAMAACSGVDGSGSNTAPVASDASVSMDPGASITGTLEATDAQGDAVKFSIVSAPSDGTLILDDPWSGAYTYVNSGTQGSDSFTFKANDGELDSNIATVSITTVIPETPATEFTATAGDRSIKLNWPAATGADSYNLYRSDTPGAGTGGSKIASGVQPPYYDNGLTNGVSYYYVVTSVNTVGESAASAEVSATPIDILISSLSFTDANLQACVAASGATYVHDLTTLNCASKSIASLAGMEALTSLTSLDLHNNSISGLGPLAGLTGLTSLLLGQNNIADLAPVARLNALVSLSIYTNSISDLGPLAGLASLTELNLNTNSISDLSLLAGHASLARLYLKNNIIIDLGPLSGLTGLTDLELSYNIISDVSPLAGLSGLTILYLDNNPGFSNPGPLAGLTNLTLLDFDADNISDVSSLASLSGLTELHLFLNSIVDVSPLASLTGLTVLDLGSNKIGGQGVGHVNLLSSLTSTTALRLDNNKTMSCSELASLITALGSPPVDTDYSLTDTDTATNGMNCTNP